MTAWICSKCGYIYDDRYGDPEHGVIPGTLFEKIPDDWTCPRCGVNKKFFVRKRD